MKRHLLVIFLPLFFAIACYSEEFIRLQDDTWTSGRHVLSPPRRTLKSEPARGLDTALVATLDGTIYLLEVGSMIPLWSFSAGSQIYSSYQAPVNDDENKFEVEGNYFIDCGDDWELYAHNSLGKLKLMKSLEEYIISTPQIGEDGGIVHGSKKTTTFLVDIKSGKVIRTYGMVDLPSTATSKVKDLSYSMTTNRHYGSGSDVEKDELPLYITRTDYTLTSFSSNSDKVLWNLSVAEFGAAYLCRDLDDSSVVELANIGSSEPEFLYRMPLPCQSRALIYRFRSHNLLEALSLPAGSSKPFYEGKALPPSKADTLPMQPNVGKVLEMLTLPFSSGQQLDTDKSMHAKGFSQNETCIEDNSTDMKLLRVDDTGGPYSSRLILLFGVIVLSLVVFKFVTRAHKSSSESTGISPTTPPSKRKKSRRAGKSGSQEKQNDMYTNRNATGTDFLVLRERPCTSGGRTIGKLFVSNRQLAMGSNGTIVLEGTYEGRLVAVKRLVRSHHDIAFKEIQNLTVSDFHPNIVRFYGLEQDQDFVYLALERCTCNLNDLVVFKSSAHPQNMVESEVTAADNITLDSINGFMQRLEMWNQDGLPSTLLFKLMRDIISGLAHLHELGIIHRDLKPQNVLITSETSLCAKLSDMGISKRLVGEMSSLSNHATGSGSSGWQAPEQLLCGRQTRAVDSFSLGCLLFFCITGGKHPFGNSLERDVNIATNKVNLFLVEHIPEAIDIISRLLDPSADMRPRALEVLHHPLLWSAEMRLSFLRDMSDRIELENRGDSALLTSLESTVPVALGGKWNDKMEPSFIDNIGHYRKYKFDSVRDLLRVIRNKMNHYGELPSEIQELVGPVPEGFDRYFRRRFPRLLIEVYKVMIASRVCEEPFFRKYACPGGR